MFALLSRQPVATKLQSRLPMLFSVHKVVLPPALQISFAKHVQQARLLLVLAIIVLHVLVSLALTQPSMLLRILVRLQLILDSLQVDVLELPLPRRRWVPQVS
jgi:uncharacterized membrane protein YdbT with pleckstrin-like domain